METLTYPYGETPEDVIRERHEYIRNDWGEGSDALYDTGDEWLAYMKRDDCLLIVLDALGQPVEREDASFKAGTAAVLKATRRRNLRISILAALGITEV